MKSIIAAMTAALAFVALTPAAHADTYEEELAQLEARFKAADTNRDGKLTQDEAKEGGMSRLARFFGRADSDDDGFVTLEQLKQRLAKRHDR